MGSPDGVVGDAGTQQSLSLAPLGGEAGVEAVDDDVSTNAATGVQLLARPAARARRACRTTGLTSPMPTRGRVEILEPLGARLRQRDLELAGDLGHRRIVGRVTDVVKDESLTTPKSQLPIPKTAYLSLPSAFRIIVARIRTSSSLSAITGS